MNNEYITKRTEDFDAAIVHFDGECKKIRTGRAHPSLIEDVVVDYYGTPTPLKQAANISIPEPRQFLIAPFDKNILEATEEAIKNARLGLTPNNEGEVIRITLPPMTEDNRKDLVKILGQKAEESRVRVRTVREEIWKEIQDEEKSGALSEDDKFACKEELQKTVDDYNARIDVARKKKEEEIMTV